MLIEFTYEKETKNKVRYQEVNEDNADIKIGVLYIDKAAYSDLGEPEKLNVTVEAA